MDEQHEQKRYVETQSACVTLVREGLAAARALKL